MTIPPQFPDATAERDTESAVPAVRYTSTQHVCVDCDGAIVGEEQDVEIPVTAGSINGDGTQLVVTKISLNLLDTIPGPHQVRLEASLDNETWFPIAAGVDLENDEVVIRLLNFDVVPYAAMSYIRVYYEDAPDVLISPTPEMTIIGVLAGCATATATSDVSQADADAKASALALAQAQSLTQCLGESTNGLPVQFNNGTNVPAALYPSAKVVSGLVGTVTKVTLTLTGVQHPAFEVVAMVLVGPDGTAVMVYGVDNENGQETVFGTAKNITFDDDAATELPRVHNPASGSYQPTVEAGMEALQLPGVAPIQPYGTDLADFIGIDPNGVWQLWVAHKQYYSVFDPAVTKIAGGWDLTISV